MSETTIAATWRTKNVLHILKPHLRASLDKTKITEDDVIFEALTLLADNLNVQLPETQGEPSESAEVIN